MVTSFTSASASRPVRTAALLSIGDEILGGDILDRNAIEIGDALRVRGFAVRSIQVVADVVGEIVDAIRIATARARLVVLTGGLGPTEDDRTRDALAAAVAEPLIIDGDALARLAARYASFGRVMAVSNARQAERPRSSRWIPNPFGTAEGIALDIDGAMVLALPGVPFEMRRMMVDSVLPAVVERFGAAAGRPIARVHAHGIPESDAGERIADLMASNAEPSVGITVSDGILTVTMRSRPDQDREVAAAQVEAVAGEVERRLGDAVFGRDGATLEEAVVRAAIAGDQTLALAESCTGGLATRLLVRVSGASEMLIEGLCTYSNSAKSRRLGVPPELIEQHGAVSPEVAVAMAEGLVRTSGASLGVSTTGIAGPGGGTGGKPVGLVHFGLSDGHVTEARRVVFGGDRETIQIRAARYALDFVRRRLAQSVAPAPRVC